jgi:hypothetical protein
LRIRANILALNATSSTRPRADEAGVRGALRAIAVAQATYRYRIEMTALPSPKSAASCHDGPAGGSAETFSVVARPLDGAQGRAFRIASDGQLTEIK